MDEVGSTDGWDLYREIHKGMRFALFGVTTMAGSTDHADGDALAALLDEWHDVALLLDAHHEHEQVHCDPLVQLHVADEREAIEAAHREADTAIASLRATASNLRGSEPGDSRRRLLRAFHLDLADFTSSYLAHLREEEDVVMPALNRAMSADELAAVTAAIRGSVPPPEMCVFIRYMVPAMNYSERLDMLGGMHAGAPPEIFEMFRDAAERCLEPDEYRAVAEGAGFA